MNANTPDHIAIIIASLLHDAAINPSHYTAAALDSALALHLPGWGKQSELIKQARALLTPRDNEMRNRATIARKVGNLFARAKTAVNPTERAILAELRAGESRTVRNFFYEHHDLREPQYIKAISAKDHANATNYSDKMARDRQVLAATVKGKIVTLATLDTYYVKSGTYNRVSLWVHIPACKRAPQGFHASGSGRAGGCGYHRPSAAAAEAFADAGIVLGSDISGVGDSAMREALYAVGDYFGFRNMAILP